MNNWIFLGKSYRKSNRNRNYRKYNNVTEQLLKIRPRLAMGTETQEFPHI